MDQYLLATADTAEWQKLYSIAQADKSHGLWENYQNIDLDTYEHMIVTMRNGETASFQGIYNNGRWPSNVSRFCNRAYINPYFKYWARLRNNLQQCKVYTGQLCPVE